MEVCGHCFCGCSIFCSYGILCWQHKKGKREKQSFSSRRSSAAYRDFDFFPALSHSFFPMKFFRLIGKIHPFLWVGACLIFIDIASVLGLFFSQPHIFGPTSDEVVNAADMRNDPLLCNLSVTPDACYIAIAKMKIDVNICEEGKHANADFSLQSCYSSTISSAFDALNFNDKHICEGIQQFLTLHGDIKTVTKDDVKQCYTIVALEGGDITVDCKRITDPDGHIQCLLFQKLLPKSIETCKKFTDDRRERNCILDIATNQKDVHLCRDFHGSRQDILDDRDLCIQQVAEQTSNPSLCNLIPEPTRSAFPRKACKADICESNPSTCLDSPKRIQARL